MPSIFRLHFQSIRFLVAQFTTNELITHKSTNSCSRLTSFFAGVHRTRRCARVALQLSLFNVLIGNACEVCVWTRRQPLVEQSFAAKLRNKSRDSIASTCAQHNTNWCSAHLMPRASCLIVWILIFHQYYACDDEDTKEETCADGRNDIIQVINTFLILLTLFWRKYFAALDTQLHYAACMHGQTYSPRTAHTHTIVSHFVLFIEIFMKSNWIWANEMFGQTCANWVLSRQMVTGDMAKRKAKIEKSLSIGAVCFSQY